MEALKLSTIVLTVTPEWYACLTPMELDSQIVLRDGLEALRKMDTEDVLELIEASILRNKSNPSLVH
jgi:hypothetical protein